MSGNGFTSRKQTEVNTKNLGFKEDLVLIVGMGYLCVLSVLVSNLWEIKIFVLSKGNRLNNKSGLYKYKVCLSIVP